MVWSILLGSLASLSILITGWQWLAARRFPLHQRVTDKSFTPAVTLLKPLKGCDSETAECLRSWLTQDYAGDVQVLFGVATADDPSCALVQQLIGEYPTRDAQLIVCGETLGANAKVSTLIQLERLARHELIVISDADVRVPSDLLENLLSPLGRSEVGLVNCFYRLANPTTLGMHWEAIAINADFWSQVLQSQTLRPLDFALGAVMAVKRAALGKIGGLDVLANQLADDYQLGNTIVRAGWCVQLCPVVVECWEAPRTWREVWRHQLRWARTIRACKPLPYFLSLLGNATFWPLLWAFCRPTAASLQCLLVFLAIRIVSALDCQQRLARVGRRLHYWWLVPVKDFLQAALWLFAFTGNHIEWRGRRFRLRSDGKLLTD